MRGPIQHVGRTILSVAVLLTVLTQATSSVAQSGTQHPAGVLELNYRPTARAQIAAWLETEDGAFVATLRLTESVAYRGIGNRPGASQMNSGYRWPYGRREAVLPIWASRRASQPGAMLFPRVIFQNRPSEGKASRTVNDFSPDNFFCLSFDRNHSRQDVLDAVTCASVFSGDKGRFLTPGDVANGYGEPYLDPVTGEGRIVSLPLQSLYPPRMDVQRCTTATCFDHQDVAKFADEARRVMPELDAVTMATLEGGVPQSELWTVPSGLIAGQYAVMMEVAVEGDYGPGYSAVQYPTPEVPAGQWDSWATGFGYPYRGQPSVVYRVPITLGAAGVFEFSTNSVHGHSAWGPWSGELGSLNIGLGNLVDDPVSEPGSGADRLLRDVSGRRLSVRLEILTSLLGAEPEPEPASPTMPDMDGGVPPGGTQFPSATGGIHTQTIDASLGDTPTERGLATGGARAIDASTESGPESSGRAMGEVLWLPDETQGSSAVILMRRTDSTESPAVGMVLGLQLENHGSQKHGHEWLEGRFIAAESALSLHRYEVRIGTEPIIDEQTFMETARPAKTATESVEGAVALHLDADAPAGTTLNFRIGDLNAETRYYVGIRGVDKLNRTGPISVVEANTPARVFATVTPCFVASAAYGSALAHEVGVLRRFRDRYMLTHGPGKWWVAQYYRFGPGMARHVARRADLRQWARSVLRPVVLAISSWL